MKKIIYISGLYSKGDMVKNIQIAKKYAIKFWNMGAAVICPHMNTAFFEREAGVTATYDDFISGDLAIISRVDVVFGLPNWKQSPGAQKEIAYAKSLSIPVLHRVNEMKKFLKKKTTSNFTDSVRRAYKQQIQEMNKKFVIVPKLDYKKPKKIR